MNKHAWILWALVLIVPGMIGLGVQFSQRNILRNRVERAVQATEENPATEEYLRMYHAWSKLSAEEKLENPWGHGQYGGAEIQRRLKESQSNQLWADISDLDKGVKEYPNELAEVLYGINWENALNDYRRGHEIADMVMIGSALLISSSGLIILGGLTRVLFILFINRKNEQSTGAQEIPSEPAQKKESEPQTPQAKSKDPDQPAGEVSEPNDRGDTDSPEDTDQDPDAESRKDKKDDSGYFGSKRRTGQDNKSPSSGSGKSGGLSPALTSMANSLSVTAVEDRNSGDPYFGWAVDGDGTEMASMMTTEPLTKELTELSEEMSAIREFATKQQDQMRKLQDGYDWMIVRRFCMRVIRCIDNIEDRIHKLEKDNDELTVSLEDIRDELVFALESSGVEQFEPDLKAPFKGLEKYVEAVRERVTTKEQELIGCIAQVVRPGYQYLINDEDVKIVRCAQVKLYEANQSK